MADVTKAKEDVLDRITEALGNRTQSALDNAREVAHLAAAYSALVNAERP